MTALRNEMLSVLEQTLPVVTAAATEETRRNPIF